MFQMKFGNEIFSCQCKNLIFAFDLSSAIAALLSANFWLQEVCILSKNTLFIWWSFMSSSSNEKGRGLAKPRGLWGHRPLVCGLFCVGAEVEGGETGRFSKAPQCGAHTVLILLKNSDFIFVRYDFGVRKTYLNSILLSSMVQHKSINISIPKNL